MARTAAGRQRSARQRHIVRHVQPADRRHPSRADLRRRPEEHGPGRRHGRHHPRRSACGVRSSELATLPTMLSYAVQAEHNSLYNTPPVVAVYALGLVMKWLLTLGGLAAVGAANERKAAKLYAEIDRTGFYRGTAQKESRSLMNVTFRLPSDQSREAVRRGVDGGGARWPQGPPGRRRNEGVDLQRVSRGRGGRARVVHAGLRAAARVETQPVTKI